MVAVWIIISYSIGHYSGNGRKANQDDRGNPILPNLSRSKVNNAQHNRQDQWPDKKHMVLNDESVFKDHIYACSQDDANHARFQPPEHGLNVRVFQHLFQQ